MNFGMKSVSLQVNCTPGSGIKLITRGKVKNMSWRFSYHHEESAVNNALGV
jgi:hypothetical protein